MEEVKALIALIVDRLKTSGITIELWSDRSVYDTIDVRYIIGDGFMILRFCGSKQFGWGLYRDCSPYDGYTSSGEIGNFEDPACHVIVADEIRTKLVF